MNNPQARLMYKRFVITLPEHLVTQINALCKEDGLNFSNLFCEAAQAYLAAKSQAQLYIASTDKEDVMDNPFCNIGEWDSTTDCVYDILR
jgi:hypothetical protein